MTKEIDKHELCKLLGLPSNPTQDAFLSSRARFKIFRAARRVGKSFTAAKDVLADICMPGTRGWIVGLTYSIAEKEFRYIHDFLIRMNKKLGMPLPEIVRDNPKAGDLYIKTAWGSEIVGKTADKPQSLLGEELDWIILAEAAYHNPDIWGRYLRPTLVTRAGRAIFPTTPCVEGKWLYDIELDIGTKLSSNEWAMFHCPAWDAPHISKEEIESQRTAMAEDEFAEQVGGEWTFYVGRVFKAFNSSIHIIDPFEIPGSWRVWEGIDYGSREATAVVFVAQAPDGTFYVFDEYYEKDKPTIIHCENVLWKEQIIPRARLSDHHALGKQLAKDWAIHGVATINNPIDRKGRRDKLMALLELRPCNQPWHIREQRKTAGDYPNIFFFKGKVPNTIREMTFLKWKDTVRQEGTLGDTVGDNHAVDALEYVVSYVKRTTATRDFVPSRLQPVSSLTGY